MKGAYILVVALFAATTIADAQVRPRPGLGDPRLQVIEFQPEQVVQIAAAPGYLVTVELAPDEQIQTIAVGDSSAWQVNATRGGNRLFIKAIQAGADTNMTIITNARTYALELRGQGGQDGAYLVKFYYPATDVLAGSQLIGPSSIVGTYVVRGARGLRPKAISDDGDKTYIDWSPDVALPAVFFIDEQGRETVANGYMRNGLYVLDSVFDRLVFRIDRHTARAVRLAPEIPAK